MLLPQLYEKGEDDEEDPRLTLIRKLLEYKRFKEISIELSKFEDEARKKFFRLFFEKDAKEYERDILQDHSLKNLTVFNLITGYRNVIANTRKEIIHPIELLNISPDIQREFLINFFMQRSEIDFSELILNMSEKMLVICTFISLLQLVLEGHLKFVVDKDNLSKFKIIRVKERELF